MKSNTEDVSAPGEAPSLNAAKDGVVLGNTRDTTQVPVNGLLVPFYFLTYCHSVAVYISVRRLHIKNSHHFICFNSFF